MKFSQLATLASVLLFVLAAVWMFLPEQLLTLWGIAPTRGSDVVSRRSAAFFMGLGIMCLLARNAEPSQARFALATGITTISLILAALGIFEWEKGNVNEQILFAVFIEVFLGVAFLMSNRPLRKILSTNAAEQINNES